MSPTYVLGLVFAGIILVTVFVKMRNSGLKESYGLWWYWIAFFTALLSLFPPILKWTAFHLGVVVPLNLGFFVAGVSCCSCPCVSRWTCRERMRIVAASLRRPRSCAFRLSAWNVASKFSRGVRPRRASLVPLRRRRPLTIRPPLRGRKRKKKR